SGALTHLELRYGGGADWWQWGMLQLDTGASVSLSAATLKSASSCALSASPQNDFTLSNMSPASFTGSVYNGICVYGGTVNANTTWDETEATYVPLNDITIALGSALTWGPGIVIKPSWREAEFLVNGTLNANGTAEQPIYVTSFRDDTIGGATDNTTELPGAGQWGRILFRSGGSGAFTHIELRYGGGTDWWGWGAIHVENAAPSVRSCTLRNNIRGLASYGASANPTIEGCRIYGNTQYGVFNGEPNHWISAVNNWWGSASGPRDPSPPGKDGDYNNGTGDRVSDFVQYRPWDRSLPFRVYAPLVVR
ncbi:MAG: hypothetical protein NZM11_08550, partial [Anaerolineales bacterium]|nr:hypothetical protein [Anaerolineales bacterium]